MNRDSGSRAGEMRAEEGWESGDNGRAPQEILHIEENKASVPQRNSVHSP